MRPPEECRGVDDVRIEIDRIDRQVIALIGERAGYVEAAAQFKTSEAEVRAQDRLIAMLGQRRAWAQEEGLSPDMVDKLYRDMVQHFVYEEVARWRKTMLQEKGTASRKEQVVIKLAIDDDAEQILALQKLAFGREAERYGDQSIPPLTQTLEGMRADFDEQVFLKAVVGDRIVGSVRAHLAGDTCHISRLIVHSDFQNQGIGTQLMQRIESLFSHARRFESFAGHKTVGALHLYQKLGYAEFRRQDLASYTRVSLEKHQPAR